MHGKERRIGGNHAANALTTQRAWLITIRTDVAHLDFVADDGCVIEPGRGLPGEEDVGVGHGLHGGRVGRVGDVSEHHSARRLALAQRIPRDHLDK